MLIRTNVTDIGDPFVVTTDHGYYMYATNFVAPGFKVWRSEDLHNWTDLGLCLDMRDSWAHQDFWAPEVIYHNGNGSLPDGCIGEIFDTRQLIHMGGILCFGGGCRCCGRSCSLLRSAEIAES